ncbi:ABC transporter substrate-binding protein [Arthrobacter sp. zg-Y769]|uniref:ABC transporter substrate-binding protein n=1 Tax=Arthrobacter sp. zg-Y769 TaxID=2894191 RepID=UPI001E5EF7A4|nr:ABC transporter substrate-binding protein [Arthrobacter sp. zg-Y769]MCC9205723.1 ABC transporter substrate-binding protein [Arthrobacter sp. zg-Y769]
MPQSVDVGSVLGGRYKVTALVLASAEQDMVLDGVDQVLNRSVSILVAAPVNASQVSASAREIATGERHGNVQVLDLGVSDGRTYLITNTANAADLLDLVIERDAPYVEPFFTDTLGSEIFGMPRSREPETVEEDRYVEREEREPREPRRPLLSGAHKPKLPRFGRNGAAAGAVAGAGSAAAARDLQFGETIDAPAEAATGGANVPPPPTSRPKQPAAPARPAKVTKWEDDEPQAAPVPERSSRSASTFPKSALAAGGYAGDDHNDGGYGDDPDEDYEDDNAEDQPNRKSGRVLIGAVLSIVLVLAVVLAVSQLGKMGDMFGSNPEAGATAEPTQEAAPAAPVPDAAAPAPAPEIAGITRLVPGNPQLDSGSDGALPQIIDGNPSSYWSSYVYASDTFGGLAQSMAMVVDLGTESAVNEVNITQLNGTGGSFSVMLNDTPDLDGATSVAQTGFTGPTTSIPVPKTDGQPATARYVIINFTQLPRLTGVQAAYPWGLRIAEIGVS